MYYKYEQIPKEHWEIYNAVEKACAEEDLKDMLQNDFNININHLKQKTRREIIDRYLEIKADSGDWRTYLTLAIKEALRKNNICQN